MAASDNIPFAIRDSRIENQLTLSSGLLVSEPLKVIMMHKKNLVVAIKVNGKVLRESNDRVELPFGSEYSILLKNLDTVRQQVQITIDGDEATGWLVLNPGENQNIERFIRGNLDKGKRFKFIERTEAVEKHRGVEAEDGLIRVEFKREKVLSPVTPFWIHNSYPYYTYNTAPNVWSSGIFHPSNASISRGGACGQSVNSSSHQATQNTQCANVAIGGVATDSGVCTMDWVEASQISAKNDVGITVDGSLSTQRFITVSDFSTEAPEVLVLHLIGRKGDDPVTVARTVSIKLACPTCGKKNRSLLKFCPECGTNLEKV